jgi:hypothetical protein
MAIALVVNTEFASPNTNGGTTGAIDTTGATLLVVHVSDVDGTGTISDSKGNTWLTGRAGLGLGPYSAIYYAENPTVGSGHTFTVTIAAGKSPNMQVMAFSGTAIASVKDQSNGASTGSPQSTLQPGSVTPTEDNELVVTGAAYGDLTATTPTISGYTISDWQEQQNSAHFGGAAAYAVQTTATATNPTWGTGRGFTGSTIVTFREGAGSSAGPPGYTELEWSLQAQTPAVDTEVYEFRVYAGSTPLDSYTVTAQLTIGTGAGAQTTNADPATLTLTGQTPTAAGTGTATVAADVATLTLTGQTPTAAGTGTTTTTADVATLTLTGQDVTAAGGTAGSTTADAATLTLSGQDVTVSGSGTATVTADPAALTFTGQDVTVTGSGTATVTADPATLTLSGQDVTPTGTGTATVTAEPALLALQGIDVGAGGGSVTNADPAALTLTGQTPTVSGSGTATVAADPATLTLTGQTPTAAASGTVFVDADPATITLFGVTPGEQPLVALITCAVTGPGLSHVVTGPSNQPVASVTGPSNQPVASVTGPNTARTVTGPAHLTRLVTGPDLVAVPVTGPDLSHTVTGPGMENLIVVSGPAVGVSEPGTVDSPTAILTGIATGPALGRTVTGPALETLSLTGPSNQPQATVTGPAATERNLTGPAHLTRVATGPDVESLHVTGPELSVDVMGPAMEDELVLTGPGVCNGN